MLISLKISKFSHIWSLSLLHPPALFHSSPFYKSTFWNNCLYHLNPLQSGFFLNYNIETSPRVTNNPLVAKYNEFPFLSSVILKHFSSRIFWHHPLKNILLSLPVSILGPFLSPPLKSCCCSGLCSSSFSWEQIIRACLGQAHPLLRLYLSSVCWQLPDCYL